MLKGNELMTAKELAEALNLSAETIWRYTREKKIPYIELGARQYRYNLEEVISKLEGQVVQEEKAQYLTDTSKKYTYQDYLELPEEPGYRFEILEGMLVKEPSPNVMHQRVSRRLQRILEDYFWEHDPQGEVFDAPLDTTFKEITVVQPDLFYVSGEQKDIIKDTRVDGPPTLVVEILSPSTSRKDRLIKMRIYQKAGVRYYWLVDPEEKTMECFALKDGLYALIAAALEEDVLEHPDFPGLTIKLGPLWEN
ncbi:Uma2 family endonuclease [Desulfitibacter alkalitolerans]|uniref:Uma2 family endonuclease n=1 Tax=Desulfitibacter alkalitolerans TaxID=264641 RepID=UPI000480858A|nr:Uma2 family endonuclease [Desulfitibacter alkalitolerans]